MEENYQTSPPQGAIDVAVQMSTFSPCQSKRGSTVFAWQGGRVHIIGRGYNHKTKFECDGSIACKATCRIDAIHAEQMALINAAKTGFIVGMEALHVKTVDGAVVASGGPSCVECSKLLRASGIAFVWLYHVDGWKQYEIDEFHRLSVWSKLGYHGTQLVSEASGSAQSAAQKTHAQPISVCRALNQPQPSGCPIDRVCDWQPIETAPKDGTTILLCNAAIGSMDFGSWQTVYEGEPNEESGWRDVGEGFDWSFATHWMPLPLPPESKS